VSPQERFKRLGRVGVAAGDRLGVEIERGRGTLVIEPAGDDRKRDSGVEHFGGHEMPQIVETELPATRCTAKPTKVFVTRFGFHAVPPPSSLNTKPVDHSSPSETNASKVSLEMSTL
jgi:hypothetical protein